MKTISTGGLLKLIKGIKEFFGDREQQEMYMVFGGRKLEIDRAPEPDTVLWENLGYSEATKRNHRLLTNIANVLVLLICFVIIYIVSLAKVYFLKKFFFLVPKFS